MWHSIVPLSLRHSSYKVGEQIGSLPFYAQKRLGLFQARPQVTFFDYEGHPEASLTGNVRELVKL